MPIQVANVAGACMCTRATRARRVQAIHDANSWVYPTINNGVYRCGFATGQAAYDAAFKWVQGWGGGRGGSPRADRVTLQGAGGDEWVPTYIA